jgi:hypothetical protein
MFAWDEAALARSRRRGGEARLAMYRRELEVRAELLHRLGYSQKRCKERLRQNVGWDFELHGKPKHAADVDRIVELVYRRGSASPGAPSV